MQIWKLFNSVSRGDFCLCFYWSITFVIYARRRQWWYLVLLRDNQQWHATNAMNTYLRMKIIISMRVRAYFGRISQPCRIREPMVNHKQLRSLKRFSRRSGFLLHGCGLYHSYGVNLNLTIPNTFWSNGIERAFCYIKKSTLRIFPFILITNSSRRIHHIIWTNFYRACK